MELVSSLIFTAKRSVATCLSTFLRLAVRQSTDAGRIATFHAIETPVDGDVNGIYNMSMSTFSSHIRAIREFLHVNEGLSVAQFGEYLSKSVSITFDDGYSSTLTRAAPLLIEHSLPCHVFVSPSLIQSSDRRYLDLAQLRDLSQLPGFTIGAHGYHHVPLTSIPPSERLSQLSSARKWIEDTIQKSVDSMSYPFGDTPTGIQAMVRQAGYTVAACSKWGFNYDHTDRLMLRRIDFWDGDSKYTATAKLLGHWNWMSRKSSS
jgi:peptidoglycan/xylan/chitin deacetylase (PgdA/CDA1 family)